MWCVISIVVLLGIIVFGAVLNRKKTDEDDTLAENDDAEAQYKRGEYYITIDLEKAKYWFEKAAAQGSSKAQARLNMVIAVMTGVAAGISKDSKGKEDFDKTMRLATASSPSPSCLFDMGIAYKQGCVWFERNNTMYLVDGLDADMAKAAYWFEKAAAMGHAEGKYQLGVCYLYGNGVEQDKKRGYQLLYEAAEMGVANARKEIENASGMEYDEFVTQNVN